jgi:hypothetical protein
MYKYIHSMKKNYVFLCLFMAFSAFLSAQTFSIARINLDASGTITSYFPVGGSPAFSGANLGTFNPSLGQTLKISGRFVRFSTMGSPCQPQSTSFSYILSRVGFGAVGGQSLMSIPQTSNIPPVTEWTVANGASDINLVTSTTVDGSYTLSVRYDYSLQFGPGPCMAGGAGNTGQIVANFTVSRAPLAVEMSSVSARKQGNKEVAVLWKTATEQGNNTFAIERSSNGSVFTTIGTVKGGNNSAAEKSYNFSDATPLSGINYYRIKSIDSNGKETMSKVVSVSVSEKGNNALQVYPNPALSDVQVEFISDEESTETVQVLDLAGRVILTQNTTLTKGLNSISLDTHAFLAGTYLVKVGAETARFVKM